MSVNRVMTHSHKYKKGLQGLSLYLQDVPWSPDPFQPSPHFCTPITRKSPCAHSHCPLCLACCSLLPKWVKPYPILTQLKGCLLYQAFLHLSWQITPLVTEYTVLSCRSAPIQPSKSCKCQTWRGQQDMTSGNLRSGGGDRSKEIYNCKLGKGLRRTR